MFVWYSNDKQETNEICDEALSVEDHATAILSRKEKRGHHSSRSITNSLSDSKRHLGLTAWPSILRTRSRILYCTSSNATHNSRSKTNYTCRMWPMWSSKPLHSPNWKTVGVDTLKLRGKRKVREPSTPLRIDNSPKSYSAVRVRPARRVGKPSEVSLQSKTVRRFEVLMFRPEWNPYKHSVVSIISNLSKKFRIRRLAATMHIGYTQAQGVPYRSISIKHGAYESHRRV